MNSNENIEDEINLKEILQSLWKEKVIVVGIALVIILISSIYTFIFVKDTYRADMDVIFKTPSTVITRYGEYTPPSTSIKDYTSYIYSSEVINEMYESYGTDKTEYNLSKDGIKNMIEITANESGVTNSESNSYTISITTGDRELSEKMLNNLFDIYEKNIRIKYKQNAIDYFENAAQASEGKLDSEITQKAKGIDYNLELLNQMDPTIVVEKALLSDATAAGMFEQNENLESLSDDIIVEEEVNENYIMLQSKNAEAQAELNALKGQLENTKILYDELVAESELIDEARGTDRESEILNGRLDVFNGFVTSLSEATSPQGPINGGKGLPIIIGTVVGLMLGVFVGLFKYYWSTTK